MSPASLKALTVSRVYPLSPECLAAPDLLPWPASGIPPGLSQCRDPSCTDQRAGVRASPAVSSELRRCAQDRGQSLAGSVEASGAP